MLKVDVETVGNGGHPHIYMHDICISTCLLQIPCLVRCLDLMKEVKTNVLLCDAMSGYVIRIYFDI